MNTVKNELQEITFCRSCGSKKLSEIFSLGELYLSDFIGPNEANLTPKFPIDLVTCKNCFLVQLKHNYPVKKFYNNHYGYRSGVNQTMRRELTDVVKKSLKYVSLNKDELVIDIGSNDGTLLNNYSKDIFRVGIDPIEKFAKDCQTHASIVITDYFNLDALKKHFNKFSKAKIITAISMFYDLIDPNQFIADVVEALDENGIFVIQQNYLVSMLAQNAFDNIVHEHLEYYSLTSLQKLLDRHNLTVIHVEKRTVNGGSFRVYVKHKKAAETKSLTVNKMIKNEKALKLETLQPYFFFRDRVREIKNRLHDFIYQEKHKGKTIYLYGASTRGNTLLQYCQLDNSLISAAVERNPDKFGKKIASVNIPIISEERARLDQPDYMLVLPWFFKEEFVEREKVYLSKGGQLIFPLPNLEIIGRSQSSERYQHSFIDTSSLYP